MNVTVFGGTGAIGRLVIGQLLDQGHHVTTYVRDPAKLDRTDEDLRVVEGQLGDAAAVRETVRGSDAVISALGPSLQRGVVGTPVATGTRNIIAAMHQEEVRRYVGLATPSVPDPRDGRTLKGRVIPLMARVMFPHALEELHGMTDAVMESGLDWTLARITNPVSKPARDTVRAGYLGHDNVGWAMSRADIARFLVGQLEDTTYLQAAPAISN